MGGEKLSVAGYVVRLSVPTSRLGAHDRTTTSATSPTYPSPTGGSEVSHTTR
jgi:hypothetical protein